jgi:hypothetical protein
VTPPGDDALDRAAADGDIPCRALMRMVTAPAKKYEGQNRMVWPRMGGEEEIGGVLSLPT